MSGGFKYLRKKIYLYPFIFSIISIFNNNKKKKVLVDTDSGYEKNWSWCPWVSLDEKNKKRHHTLKMLEKKQI